MLDLVIVGGSAAGLTSAIYAARRRVNFKLISDNLGGEMASAGTINNWPSTIQTTGFELAQKMIEQVKTYNIDLDQGWRVEKIIKEKNYFIIETKNSKNETKEYQTKTVIIATGIHPSRLNIPGEKEFFHKGLTYCTVCDGPLFKNKITTTIGNGSSALESAIMMANIAKKVYLFSTKKKSADTNWGFPRGENILLEKIKSTPNIEIIYSANAKEVIGDKTVKALKYQDENGEEKTVETQGIMVHTGMEPNSDFIDCVKKDARGQIITDKKCATTCPGIFAAGDVGDLPFKQIVIAAGQGAVAALAAVEYINKWKE